MTTFPKEIKLEDIVEHIEMASDNGRSFLNFETGDIVYVSDEIFEIADGIEDVEDPDEFNDCQDWMVDDIKIAYDILFGAEHYAQLPDQNDIDEYSMMEKFAIDYPDEEISDELYNAIKGRGAFRYFKDTLLRYGIRDNWFRYRDEQIKSIALEWLNELVSYLEER